MLHYADDATMIADNKKDLEELLKNHILVCERVILGTSGWVRMFT